MMGWVVALLAALVVIAGIGTFYVCYLLEEMNRRILDLQIGIIKLRNGE